MPGRAHIGGTLVPQLLRSWRTAYNGERDYNGHDGRSSISLSQMRVALESGTSLTVISRRENGLSRIPLDKLDQAAKVYRLTPELRDVLWHMRTGSPPPSGPSRPDTEAIDGWAQYIHLQPFPAVALDATWSVTAGNQAWNSLFEPAGHEPPANFLQFTLISPYARQLFGDWSGWARPLLYQLRVEDEHRPTPELRRIATQARRDPTLAQLWREAGEAAYASSHHDGQVRYIRPPASDRLHRVRLLVSSPQHDPRRRVITLLPTPENTMSNLPSTMNPDTASAGDVDMRTRVWLPTVTSPTAA
jgi:transcriptional regulator with XRE-family HTH domain